MSSYLEIYLKNNKNDYTMIYSVCRDNAMYDTYVSCFGGEYGHCKPFTQERINTVTEELKDKIVTAQETIRQIKETYDILGKGKFSVKEFLDAVYELQHTEIEITEAIKQCETGITTLGVFIDIIKEMFLTDGGCLYAGIDCGNPELEE